MPRDRGAVIIIDAGDLLLIERVRASRTYYLFPGGGMEPGETVEQAAVREAREELGLQIALGPLVALVEHDGDRQFHFAARILGGEFGSGDGLEYSPDSDPDDGSYRPVRLPVSGLDQFDVRPHALASALAAGPLPNGGPILHFQD